MAVCAGALFHLILKALFSARRCALKYVWMPRYELAPLTMAKMENSNTCGNRYSLPSARRGSGIVASSARNGSKDFTAISDRFGRLTQIQSFPPGGIVRHAFRIKTLKTVASGTQLRALNSPGTGLSIKTEPQCLIAL